jgi:hypothetical protein
MIKFPIAMSDYTKSKDFHAMGDRKVLKSIYRILSLGFSIPFAAKGFSNKI